MKDNISIIFAAIVGTFLIVILPLFSILDRQDSMSYNVVLTATTNFVDKVRTNGFIDRDSYNNYLAALASTSNTYKVTIEAYRKKLIHDTDENGNILKDKYSEEKELINTYDITKEFESVSTNDTSNVKGNIYLFNEDDEIYVKVKNTNITAGSLMYRFLSGITNTNVINISYGGVINNINWELYGSIQKEEKNIPEVVLTVPVNSEGETNITKKDNPVTEPTSEEERYINDELNRFLTGEKYAYLYDLTEEKNKTIKVLIELKNIDSLNVENIKTNENYTKLRALETDADLFSKVKSRILDYIRLNGMYAYKNIELKKDNQFYFLELTLTNVKMSSLDFVSSIASITVLPGLGQDINGVLSLGTESVKLELMDESSVNSVAISNAYNFEKLIESNLKDSIITTPEVFVGQKLAFVISYTGINSNKDEDEEDFELRVKNSIKDNLTIHSTDHSQVAFYTLSEFINKYGEAPVFEINTGIYSKHIIIVFKYTEKNTRNNNYLELESDWIETNIDYSEEEIEGDQDYTYASGAKSASYAVLVDNVAPLAPGFELEGTLGDNGWYTSDVKVTMIPSKTDLIARSELYSDTWGSDSVVGGVGVYKNYIETTGANIKTKAEYVSEIELTKEGTTNLFGYAKDYLGNEVKVKGPEVKIDKTAPSKPKIEVEKGDEGNDGWYKSNVEIKITPGVASDVNRTTYKVEKDGAALVNETNYKSNISLQDNGRYQITVRTYDNAGNYSETIKQLKIDKTSPESAEIDISGSRRNGNMWYYTDVEIKIKISAGEATSGLGTCKYRVKEKNSTNQEFNDFTETEKTIKITESGEYTVTVITYTTAGNSKTKELNIKIDKESPKPVEINLNGTSGIDNWYTSSVNISLTSKGDNGPSGEVNYIRYTLDESDTEIEVESGSIIKIEQDGVHLIKVYSTDNAGNRTLLEKTIKIDKVKPNADFKITGKMGDNGWYISNVKIDSRDQLDETSGIKSIKLSHLDIKEDTKGTKITLTILDNAGNETIKDMTIKVDKTKPTTPVISTSDPTGSGIPGVLLSNSNVDINITPGIDNTSGVNRTTYKIEKDGVVFVNEQNYESSYKLTQNGEYVFIVRTYDNAGNYSETSKVIWINKDKPKKIVINSINDVDVRGMLTKTVTSNNSNLKINIGNLEEASLVVLKLINQDNYEQIEKTFEENEVTNGEINYSLNVKGKYWLSLTQSNMYGSTSYRNDGTYYYEYE